MQAGNIRVGSGLPGVASLGSGVAPPEALGLRRGGKGLPRRGASLHFSGPVRQPCCRGTSGRLPCLSFPPSRTSSFSNKLPTGRTQPSKMSCLAHTVF